MFGLFSKNKRYIGLSYGAHDAGIAVYDQDGNLVFSSQAERLNRRKSNHLLGNINELFAKAGLKPLSSSDHIFSVYPQGIGQLFAELAFEEKKDKKDLLLDYGNLYKKYNLYHVDHHLSHAAASWMFRKDNVMEESLYFVFDGRGFKSNLGSAFYSIGSIGNSGVVEFEYNKLLPNRFSTSFRLDHIKMPHTNPLGVAGKLMGLAGYCTDAKVIPFEKIDREALDKRFAELNNTMDKDLMTAYASVYVSYVDEIKNEIERRLKQYPHKNIVVGGGTFLALELNTFIADKERNVIFGPPVNDSGIALGSGALGYFLINKKWPKPLKDPFHQWCPKQEATPYISPEEVAVLLVDKKRPIGLMIGKGELGPRALGHRSLLAVPTMENKVLLSETIKKREFYRPLAPIVTDRDFLKFFTGPKGKYMQYRNHCTLLAKKILPGIVHNDGTARAQVLEREDNPWLYDVLVEVGKKTGAECLINTSLNGPGAPISNTVEDVKKEMDTSLFELIVMD